MAMSQRRDSALVLDDKRGRSRESVRSRNAEHGDDVHSKICGRIVADEARHEMACSRIVDEFFCLDPERSGKGASSRQGVDAAARPASRSRRASTRARELLGWSERWSLDAAHL